MAISENAQAQMLRFAMGLSLDQCKMIVSRYLALTAFSVPPIMELNDDQNELAAFAVGAMMERIASE
jgi:hypothetical protein